MEVGVSTASLFKRAYNEDAVKILDKIDAKVCEVFLGTYSEYKPSFAQKVKENLGGLQVHSIHTLNTHFEPQLFAYNPRAIDDAYEIMKNCMLSAQILGAKYYTLHGIARFKKGAKYTNYPDIANKLAKLNEFCQNYGVEVCLENVEWAYYNHVGFFTEICKHNKNIKTCLDIKQARVSGDSYIDYINEMQNSIKTVHLSDYNNVGKICLPGSGEFDFEDLFKRLKSVGFDGNMLIEVYYEDYNSVDEIKESLNYLRELKYKIF